MKDLLLRLEEASSSVEFEVNGGRELGLIDVEINGDKYSKTDKKQAAVFAAELGKRIDSAKLKLKRGGNVPAITAYDDSESFLIYLDLVAPNGLEVGFRAYGDRDDGSLIYFELSDDSSGYDDDVRSFRKLWPDFGKGR